MILKIIEYRGNEYQEMLDLRNEILRKPLGLVFTEAQLAVDADDILIGCFNNVNPGLMGCCILTGVDKETIKLRQMAVWTHFQGQGIGRELIAFAENVAKGRGYKKIILHARKSVEGFYQKLGYAIVGDEFLEVSIPHYEMEKYLYP